MFCPVCSQRSLKEVPVLGVKVDRCKQCGGVWYDKGEFEKLVQVSIKGLKPTSNAPVSSRCCPHDRSALVQMTYPQTMVKVDLCTECEGLWLDKDEIKEIRSVRRHLRRAGKLEKYGAIPGFKGKVIRTINQLIDALLDYSDEF